MTAGNRPSRRVAVRIRRGIRGAAGSPTGLSALSLCVGLLSLIAPARAGTPVAIDPYGATRRIPDITGGPGDSVTLAAGDIIDIVILGDGYLAAESTVFITQAQSWYNAYFGTAAAAGIRPYPLFAQAFRVRAVWQASASRTSLNRSSYYRVNVDSAGTQIAGDSWWNGGKEADEGFNDSLFQELNALSPLNLKFYPSDLDISVNGNDIVGAMAGVYQNLYLVMLVCTQSSCGFLAGPSGLAQTVTQSGGTAKVKVGFGNDELHEFGHAFTYLRDEYVKVRGTAADWTNPHPDSMSIFNLSNMTYSDVRCDLPWKHLAPGSTRNPNVFSLIGNLFVGGKGSDGEGWEDGVWHSEYKCLMNGTRANYQCNRTDTASTGLRDGANMCFWCEEITAMRILERAGEFIRQSGGVPGGNYNSAGRAWFQLWDASLRDDYYDYFNIDSAIAVRDSCYALWAGGSCVSCSSACDLTPLPPCLPDCDIREVGNAIYVDGLAGLDANPGSRSQPKGTVAAGTAAACTPGRLVMIRGGAVSYPAPAGLILTDAAILIPDGCVSVVIGK